jgi:hypothetical protein
VSPDNPETPIVPEKVRHIDKIQLKKFATELKSLSNTFKKPCTATDADIQKLCDYLDYLNTWFAWFNDDYTRVRRAVCNLDKKVFVGSGWDTTGKYELCDGGSGDDYTDPPAPPKW